ncbi:MAG: Uma2 family endonuclease [Steroidobacter sp.]
MNAMTESGITKHRLTVDDYFLMAEVGVLAPDARVELIEGEIIDMPPMGSQHGGTGNFLLRRFTAAIGDSAIVSSQSTLVLGRYNAPEPDLMVLRPRADYYRRSNPTADDVLLLVEVSDSTLPYDRKIKAPLYARYRIPEVWIVNLRQLELLRLRQPGSNDCTEIETIKSPGLIQLAALGDIQVDLSGLFDDCDQPAS